jgi:hypothetical protein
MEIQLSHKNMSEIFELLHQARLVSETAKDAMPHSLAADKTTEGLARKILAETKRLLGNNPIVQSVNFPDGDLSWVSVRSAMQACNEALSQAYSERIRANQRGHTRGGTWPD